MRLFLAINLPSLDTILAAQEQIKDLVGVKLVAPQQVHITLKFLGQVPQDVLADFIERLEHVRASPFQITLDGVDGFPTLRDARVLFLAGQEPPELTALAKAVDAATPDVSADHPFKLHATIARVQDAVKLPVIAIAPLTFTVKEFVLYDSEPGAQGSTYNVVRKFSLEHS